MTGPNAPRTPDDARIARARRTALWLGLLAVAVFLGFIAMAAMNR
ncbi:hypothetical protein GCM10008101_19500 [Lysobacter xinjiangensis]|uniref:Uncharacterized protein n=1 Tax=Cognatilysobacter xinjiangensis TaxID=546892 RepID=A0ABQ3C2P5_9GAMM|nr:hypothetical protein [Lysobacter xinjiangensis]GGZ65630.1 hypothetical protein GCM10008101_19500 [Lysobacter xinjiangensis]